MVVARGGGPSLDVTRRIFSTGFCQLRVMPTLFITDKRCVLILTVFSLAHDEQVIASSSHQFVAWPMYHPDVEIYFQLNVACTAQR